MCRGCWSSGGSPGSVQTPGRGTRDSQCWSKASIWLEQSKTVSGKQRLNLGIPQTWEDARYTAAWSLKFEGYDTNYRVRQLLYVCVNRYDLITVVWSACVLVHTRRSFVLSVIKFFPRCKQSSQSNQWRWSPLWGRTVLAGTCWLWGFFLPRLTLVLSQLSHLRFVVTRCRSVRNTTRRVFINACLKMIFF